MPALPEYAQWFVVILVGAVGGYGWIKWKREVDEVESWKKRTEFWQWKYAEEAKAAKARSGLSLLEVLISIFILAIGLLGVAALIPIGKLAISNTNIADRTGACGRAAMRDIQVRKMLGFNNWSRGPSPGQRTLPQSILADAFVVDPLGHAHGLTGNMGPLQRFTLLENPVPIPPALGTQLSLSRAQQLFMWHDDLVFTKPGDGSRPQPVIVNGEHQCTGNFTWFFTANPSPSESNLSVGNPTLYPMPGKRHYNVSVAVCYKRDFIVGETVVDVTGFTGGGYGGGTISIASPIPKLKTNMWVLLVGTKEVSVNNSPYFASACRWYRVVSVANQLNPPLLSLVGPDWDLAAPSSTTPVSLVFVDRVSGVYSMSMVAGQ